MDQNAAQARQIELLEQILAELRALRAALAGTDSAQKREAAPAPKRRAKS